MARNPKFESGTNVRYRGGIYRVLDARTNENEPEPFYGLQKVSGAGPSVVREARERELAGELLEVLPGSNLPRL
jgi:hypothetical protein